MAKHELMNGIIWQGRVKAVAAHFPVLDPGCPYCRNFLTIKLEVCGFLLKELGMDLGAEHCLLLHGQVEKQHFSCDPLIAIFWPVIILLSLLTVCLYTIFIFLYIYKLHKFFKIFAHYLSVE